MTHQPRPAPAPIAVIGELNLDLMAVGLASLPQLGREVIAESFDIVLGSASAIFAVGVSRLGHPVSFYSKVGADDFGKRCNQLLETEGVSTCHVQVDPNSTTGTTIALSTVADRALVTFLGAIAEFGYDNIPVGTLEGNQHLHMTSYFLQRRMQPAFARLFREAHASGLSTSFDPNSDPAQSWDKNIWEVIREADIFFVNEDEARALTGAGDAGKALDHLASACLCAVIKMGPQGALARKNGVTAFADPFPVTVADTTGAGDSFAAGFVHAHLLGCGLQECLRMANACGAMSATQPGGTSGQPTAAQLAQFLDIRAKETTSLLVRP